MEIDSERIVEHLHPSDFYVYCGDDIRDGKLVSLWKHGPQVVEDLGMFVDNVTIVVTDDGSISIVPIKKTSAIGRFCCAEEFWIKTDALLNHVEKGEGLVE